MSDKFGDLYNTVVWPMPQRIKVKHGRHWYPGMGWRFNSGWVGGAPGRCNYVANGHREGVIEEMKAFIKRSEESRSDDDFYEHHNK